MKKVIFLAAIAVTFTMTSCLKEYSCTCTVDGVSETDQYGKTSKGAAEDACNNTEAQYQAWDASASCELN